MDRGQLLQVTPEGIYCQAGDFYIDPWRPVEKAVITHAHSDHARWGSKSYLAAMDGLSVLRRRVGSAESSITGIDYGKKRKIGDAIVSLHPAGHILGSAQVRVECKGEVWVVSGDYKMEPCTTCTPFEPVKCHTFITESTFGLPIYRWEPQQSIFDKINKWWLQNQQSGKCSILYGYALGKSQRLLSGLDPDIGPIYCHGAVYNLNKDYYESGVQLPPAGLVSEAPGKMDWSKAMIIAPPSSDATPWMRKFGNCSTAFASGWMMIRGTRRRRALDRGFALSDHVDWDDLLKAIALTEAETVWVTHGYSAQVVRYLTELGKDARVVETRFEGEVSEEGVDAAAEDIQP